MADAFDPLALRADVPMLAAPPGAPSLAWLDNASTTQRPEVVIDAVTRTDREDWAPVHRSVYAASRRATEAFETARRKLQRFLGAADPSEIVFVRGTTEAVNLVAHGIGTTLAPGDEVLVTALEHHSNLVPWQLACQRAGATLRIAPVDDEGHLLVEEFAAQLTDRTRMVAMTHVSNAIGTVVPVAELTALARDRGVPVLIDGAQAVSHLDVDVSALGCDFYALSGHKMFGPGGIGVLYGRREQLAALPPWQGGGAMIRSATYQDADYEDPPQRFEAGTPHLAGAVGLGAAVDWLGGLDREAARRHEAALHAELVAALADLPGVRLVGTAEGRIAIQSFVMDGVDSHEVAMLADQHGVAVRSGHHCAQPLLARLGHTSTVRASLALYNTSEDIARLATALADARALLA